MGVIVNALAIVVAGTIGLVAKVGIPERIHERLMQAIALCVLVIGIEGALEGQNPLVMIVSMVVGAAIGEAFNLDHHLNWWIAQLQERVKHIRGFKSFGEGFITATLLFCVGSMAIVGSLESGMIGNHATLYAKSLMDATVSLLLASTLGIGVIFSSIPILIYEGSLALMASYLEPLLRPEIVSEVIAVGSLTLIALSFNLLKITNIKIMNLTPAIFLPFLLSFF